MLLSKGLCGGVEFPQCHVGESACSVLEKNALYKVQLYKQTPFLGLNSTPWVWGRKASLLSLHPLTLCPGVAVDPLRRVGLEAGYSGVGFRLFSRRRAPNSLTEALSGG